ncbi:MAG: hypothetical protein V8S42_01855 [Lachnospiraceae bacterium]
MKWLYNSVVLSVGTMVLAMGTSVTASYAFSRFRFQGRNSYFADTASAERLSSDFVHVRDLQTV